MSYIRKRYLSFLESKIYIIIHDHFPVSSNFSRLYSFWIHMRAFQFWSLFSMQDKSNGQKYLRTIQHMLLLFPT